ncbi:hypothetical protein [Rhizorhapis sp. SPR117]|uniref:hypothetical protein n=1 Tax=Rhizorhapis sp. SPR117 TaxID=2912611 RepID=UPI001F3E661D|nr:hypothetical protein [Rhizorhapis sp. SPR117]
MSSQLLPISRSGKDESPSRKQIIMILQNIDPLNPVARFVPERCDRDGWGPFDVNVATVTGGQAEEVSVRVVILQDDLVFMTDEQDVTAGCATSQKYLRRVSPPSSEPARDLEFLIAPLGPNDPELQFNLGLIASGERTDCDGKPVRWRLPFILDPKIRNLN